MERYAMSIQDEVKNLLIQKFEEKRVVSSLNYFLSAVQKFEEGDWENSLGSAGKFVEEVNANEMDSSTILPICAWILAELVRFCAKGSMTVEEAKKIIDALTERKYPIFEKIENRIYVDRKKFRGALECGLLILYKLYPTRISKFELTDLIKLHNFRYSAIKFERFSPYIDSDINGEILLRAPGRRKAEEILSRV